MDSIETALVVLVPEAEALAKPFRDEHDPAAAIGVPAHITILYPFLPPDALTPRVNEELRQCFSNFSPFRYSLRQTRRFPGVLYLAPEPDDVFRDLTLAIWARYPERPPYGGRHPDIVPHLCIAQLEDEKELDRVAACFAQAAQEKLPINASAQDVALMDNRSGRWQVRSTLPLGMEN